MKSFLAEAESRGFINQTTNGIETLSDSERPYIGFDLTSDSLHVGSLVQIMILRLMKRHGMKPIVLLGSGTSRIGDPSGKTSARQMLSPETIGQNKAGILKVFNQFGLGDLEFVDNHSWLSRLGYLDFLVEAGRHVSVNKMLKMDSVKNRLDNLDNLSYLEFSYMLLQAWDFISLNDQFGSTVQVGGSDQWGNITLGIDLARKMRNVKLFGITTPLVKTANGQKMGKSEKGAVWLSEEKLSAFDYYQFWRQTNDSDVGNFLRMFTELPIEEISNLESGDINNARKMLAEQATRICHNVDFANSLPEIEITELSSLLDVVLKTNIAKTNSEARRLISAGAVKLDGVKVLDPKLNKIVASTLTVGKGKNYRLLHGNTN